MTIDEAITKYKEIASTEANCPAHCNISCDKCVQESEQLAEWLEELKTIKEMDLDIPQHFTKEQSEWIKSYCIQRNKEFYNKAIDDFAKLMKEAMEHDWSTTKICDQIIYNNLYDKCNEIAEQLKDRVNNEMY